jgi:hypothetical protein
MSDLLGNELVALLSVFCLPAWPPRLVLDNPPAHTYAA